MPVGPSRFQRRGSENTEPRPGFRLCVLQNSVLDSVVHGEECRGRVFAWIRGAAAADLDQVRFHECRERADFHPLPNRWSEQPGNPLLRASRCRAERIRTQVLPPSAEMEMADMRWLCAKVVSLRREHRPLREGVYPSPAARKFLNADAKHRSYSSNDGKADAHHQKARRPDKGRAGGVVGTWQM